MNKFTLTIVIISALHDYKWVLSLNVTGIWGRTFL